jgi:hypothetical protein
MAKAKAKKNSGKAKKDTGTKLAKSVRKFSPLKDLMNSNLGREILADALIAAAGAAAAALTRTRTAKKAGSAAADAGSQAADTTKDAMQTAAGAVAGVVTEAARQFLPASLISEEDEGRGKSAAKKPHYVNLASDHSDRKTSRKTKDEKAEKH